MTAHCTTCTCAGDDIPQPSRSDPRKRRAVIDGALAVLETKRRARSHVRDDQPCTCGTPIDCTATDHGTTPADDQEDRP